MITVCLLSKSHSKHVLQVQNAGEVFYFPNLNDKEEHSGFQVWG